MTKDLYEKIFLNLEELNIDLNLLFLDTPPKIFEVKIDSDFIKWVFPKAIELECDDFFFLNTPEICYDLNERKIELLRILSKKTISK